MPNMKIGFIGLGIMGSRMAANLQKAGHELTVFNRDKSKCKALLDAGASLAETPKAAADGMDFVITMVADPSAVQAVALGENGLLM